MLRIYVAMVIAIACGLTLGYALCDGQDPFPGGTRIRETLQ